MLAKTCYVRIADRQGFPRGAQASSYYPDFVHSWPDLKAVIFMRCLGCRRARKKQNSTNTHTKCISHFPADDQLPRTHLVDSSSSFVLPVPWGRTSVALHCIFFFMLLCRIPLKGAVTNGFPEHITQFLYLLITKQHRLKRKLPGYSICKCVT